MSPNLQKRNLLGIEVLEVPGDPQGPGIILFHGYGADGYDLVPLSQVYKNSPKPTWFFPTGPMKIQLMPNYYGHSWFPVDISTLQKAVHEGRPEDITTAFPSELTEARRLGEQLIAELNIPLSKLFLGGFSQGAILATEIALHAFEKIAGLILLSGTIVNEKEWNKLALMHSGTSFFQSHGINDPLLPFSKAKQLEELLVNAGFKGHLTTFLGGHEIPTTILLSLKDFFTKLLK